MLFFYVLSVLWLTAAAEQSCSPGQTLFNSTCFQFFPISVDFNTAESFCAASSGHLASIHSSSYNKYVSSQAQKYTNGSFWIGAKSLTKPVNWYWTDGSNFTYHNYKLEQSVEQGDICCLKSHSETGLWMTEHCQNQKLPFVCQYPPQKVPTCRPIPSHCPSGYTWFQFTDFCYKNYVRRATFFDAEGTCHTDGGVLASIHSQAENDFIVELTKVGFNAKKGEVWIGFVNRNNCWQWTDGTPVRYTNWGPGEPNNKNKEFMTVLQPDKQGGKWNNVASNYQRAFVCKRKALH